MVHIRRYHLLCAASFHACQKLRITMNRAAQNHPDLTCPGNLFFCAADIQATPGIPQAFRSSLLGQIIFSQLCFQLRLTGMFSETGIGYRMTEGD